jgi:hypothetical protein
MELSLSNVFIKSKRIRIENDKKKKNWFEFFKLLVADKNLIEGDKKKSFSSYSIVLWEVVADLNRMTIGNWHFSYRWLKWDNTMLWWFTQSSL